MTEKEKALDLWLMYYELIDDIYSNYAAKEIAKRYASIAVDEILSAHLFDLDEREYWIAVKQEIERIK